MTYQLLIFLILGEALGKCLTKETRESSTRQLICDVTSLSSHGAVSAQSAHTAWHGL
jgi:hypothetical protein